MNENIKVCLFGEILFYEMIISEFLSCLKFIVIYFIIKWNVFVFGFNFFRYKLNIKYMLIKDLYFNKYYLVVVN